MSNAALQDVIAELKNRGLRAGEDEGKKVVADAEAKAAKIVADAREQAAKIVTDANGEAAQLRKQLDAELRQSANIGLEAFRQALEKSLVVPTIDAATKPVLDDPALLKEVILATVEGFSAKTGTSASLQVILPQALRDKLDAAFVAEIQRQAKAGVKVTFADGFTMGFKVAPEGSGYQFDYTGAGFQEIFLSYLAPRFREYFVAKAEATQ
jgi:V/A-type H+-transporting ATPase subunit E